MLSKSTKGWRHGQIAIPYNDTSAKRSFDHHHHHNNNHPRYSKGKSIKQSDKDKELEMVMIAIHQFFIINSANKEYEDGVSKTELCQYVIDQYPKFSISKFRFALNQALRLKLVERVCVSDHGGHNNLSPRSSGSIKIKV